MKTWLGCDPGKSGFITSIKEGGFIESFAVPKIGKEVDLLELFRLFKNICSSNPEDIYCVIEDVHAIFGSSAGSTFAFGYITGVIEAFVISNNISYTKVAPKKWQKQLHEGVPNQQKLSSTGKTMVNDTKLMSIMAAKRIFPDVDLRATARCKKPDDNKVDSLLIAEYCRRNF